MTPQRRLPGSRLGKRLAPTLSRLVGGRGLLRLATVYLDVLQGRGSGTGWDMAGEVRAASSTLQHVEAPVVIDGGANIGAWTLAMHQVLGHDRARFYLIEPQASCRVPLERLGVPNCTLVQVALGSESGTAVLSGSSPGFGAASLYDRHDTYFEDTSVHKETVRVFRLDDLVSEQSLARIDLLKLDLEGGEFEALKGATASLQARLIRAIAFEFGSANIYSRTFFRDFWELLTPLGFRLFRILPGGGLLPISAYSEELEHFRGVSNYLAVLATTTAEANTAPTRPRAAEPA